MELRPGPYDRPNGESRRGAERGPPEREESCPFCRWPVEKWWPLIYAPVVELGAETWRSCHLKCLLDALRRDEEHPRAAGVETSFGESVLELVTRAEKALFSRKPSARLGLEDERMCLAAQSTLPPHLAL
ncbi:unnamed protein product [Durusdinium trenchii]|uniref:Uncharacterized protein n=1 Tax=Durusdinium trenchii TaxID=1381693 RepID=A0ABP0QJP7_9DINO